MRQVVLKHNTRSKLSPEIYFHLINMWGGKKEGTSTRRRGEKEVEKLSMIILWVYTRRQQAVVNLMADSLRKETVKPSADYAANLICCLMSTVAREVGVYQCCVFVGQRHTYYLVNLSAGSLRAPDYRLLGGKHETPRRFINGTIDFKTQCLKEKLHINPLSGICSRVK